MNNMAGSLAQYNEIYWPWPIAVYLFLAGLSAGSMIVALLVKFNRHEASSNNIWDAMIKAGALISPLTISLGLLMLILDLGKPLSFYWLLLKYNFSSVMTLGVLFLLVFVPLAWLFALMIFEAQIKQYAILKPLYLVINYIKSLSRFAKAIECVIFVLALCVGAYTGFLLSAISKVPLWNTPMLPLLFLVSGFSSGVAANILVGMSFFHASLNKENIKYLLMLDLRAILLEIPILLMLFVGMHYAGGDAAISLAKIFSDGFYSMVFWVFVFGIGLAMPVIIAATVLKNHAYKPAFIIINSCVVLIGVVALRFFIVYAGQVSVLGA